MTNADTRIALLDAAYELILNQGYAATGVGEICRRAGVSKGSFYHFFETKQRCALEMLRHHLEESEHELSGPDGSEKDEVEAALQYVRHIEQRSENMFKDGCLLGTFALELAETHPELQAEVSEIFRDITQRFEKILAPIAHACGQPDAPSPRELAEQMLTVIEGGVVLSKAHRDLGAISRGLRLFRHYLETLCGSETASSA